MKGERHENEIVKSSHFRRRINEGFVNNSRRIQPNYSCDDRSGGILRLSFVISRDFSKNFAVKGPTKGVYSGPTPGKNGYRKNSFAKKNNTFQTTPIKQFQPHFWWCINKIRPLRARALEIRKMTGALPKICRSVTRSAAPFLAGARPERGRSGAAAQLVKFWKQRLQAASHKELQEHSFHLFRLGLCILGLHNYFPTFWPIWCSVWV